MMVCDQKSKIRSKGKGRGLGTGKGSGPLSNSFGAVGQGISSVGKAIFGRGKRK